MARERYLLNADEETIHKEKIVLATKKQKWENFWYYNTRKVIAISIAVAMVVGLFYSIFSKTKADYTIGIVAAKNLDSSVINMLEEQLSEYGKDLNGDGIVYVAVNNCSIGDGNTSGMYSGMQSQVGSVRYYSDLNNGDSMIWLHDEIGYYSTDDKNDPLFKKIFKGENPSSLSVEDVKAFDAISFEGFEDEFFTPDDIKLIFSTMSVSIRDTVGTATGTKEKDEYYKECEILLENLINGTKTTVF